MPKCPLCGKEINFLINVCTEIHEYKASLGEEGTIEYIDLDVYPISHSEDGFFCPECRAKLFDSEEEATEFLST